MDRQTLGLKGKTNPNSNTRHSESNDKDETHSKQPRRYKCRLCRLDIANVEDEIKIGDIPTLSAQVNPHGFVHEVITVSNAANCILDGPMVPADSWFPGYCWRICLCYGCLQHLGWSYHHPKSSRVAFFGLRRNAVIQDTNS